MRTFCVDCKMRSSQAKLKILSEYRSSIQVTKDFLPQSYCGQHGSEAALLATTSHLPQFGIVESTPSGQILVLQTISLPSTQEQMVQLSMNQFSPT